MRRYKRAKAALIFWTLFIGIGAVAGATAMLIDPSGKALGMDEMLPYFQKLPFADALFRNFVFSGIMLLIVNGITNLVAAALLIKNRKAGVVLGTVFGVTLMLWICIQFYMFPLNCMSTAYFVFGAAQFITGIVCLIGLKQSEFSFDENAYKNVGKNKNILVVYFSRCGYTRKIAYERADELGADICEIKAAEKISGNIGFWQCGRLGMLKKQMPIEKLSVDVEAYEKIVICSPVWVFGISAPVRTFLSEAKGKVKSLEFISVHFMNAKFFNIKEQAESLIGVKTQEFRSYRCRYGKIKRII